VRPLPSRLRERDFAASRCPLIVWVVAENLLVLVLSGVGEQRWPLTASRRGRDWLLTITSPDGKSWVAEGADLFKTLRALRRILDPLGIRLGVNGARRDAWALGTQCDMGEGRAVYLLAEGRAGRPEQVSTLGPTPLRACLRTCRRRRDRFGSSWAGCGVSLM
jgi:hypothetical protein